MVAMLIGEVLLGEHADGDDWMNPWLDGEALPELAPGEVNLFNFHASWGREEKKVGGSKGTMWELAQPMTCWVTSERVIWVARQWGQRASYLGTGLIGSGVALAANLVSERRQRREAALSAAAGQLRYEWLTSVHCRRQTDPEDRAGSQVFFVACAAMKPSRWHYVRFGGDPQWVADVAERILDAAAAYSSRRRRMALPAEHARLGPGRQDLTWNESGLVASGSIKFTSYIGAHMEPLPTDDPDYLTEFTFDAIGAPAGYRSPLLRLSAEEFLE